MNGYEHTERAPLYLLLLAVSAILGLAGVLSGGVPPASIGLILMSVLFAVISACFAHLTVRDQVDRLVVRFGPVPLFGWSTRWEDIDSVEAGRSAWIDGWGMHWLPGRGMTINIWGLDCVVLRVKGRIVRVGTDDSERLAGYVQKRIAEQSID